MASIIKADTLQSTTSNVFVLNSAGTEYARFDSSGNLQLAGAFSSGTFSANGNVTLSAANTKILNSSGNPILQQTGSILQVVNGTTTSTVSSASTTVVDTGLTATITPISSTSKILVLVSQRFFKTQASSAGGTVYLQRGATNLLTDQRVCLNDTTSVGGDQKWSCCYLDSPATTSATTYKTQFGNTNTSGFFYVNLDSNQAQITLLEISA
jgi:hypothetical protein